MPSNETISQQWGSEGGGLLMASPARHSKPTRGSVGPSNGREDWGPLAVCPHQGKFFFLLFLCTGSCEPVDSVYNAFISIPA